MLEEFKKFLKKRGKSGNTINSYVRNIMSFINWHESNCLNKFSSLRRNEILVYKTYLLQTKKYKLNTINVKLSALIRFNEFLIFNKSQHDIVINSKDIIKIKSSV